MSWNVKNMMQSELVRNSARLLSANVVAQAIGLLVFPILSRIYAPENFGLLNLFFSIGGILVLLSTAEYQNAIVLPREEERARSLVHVCAILLLVLTSLLICSIPFAQPIASLFNTPDLACWWWMMPIYVLALGGWQTVRNILLRHKAFGNLSGYQYTQSILNAAGKCGFGAVGFLSGGLIVSSVLAPLLSLGISIGVAWKKVFRPLGGLDKNACLNEAKNYINFPCYSLPRSLVNNISSNLPILLLTPVFGLTEIGLFGMALTLSFIPLNLIVQSVYQVLFQHSAQLVNERKRIDFLWTRFALRAFLVLIPSFALLYAVVPTLTAWLLGDEWRVSGEYIRLMLPWLLMVTVTGSMGFLSDIFAKQHVALGIEIVYLTVRVAVLAIGMALHDFRLTILLYSIAGTVVITGQLLWFRILIRNYHRSLEAD